MIVAIRGVDGSGKSTAAASALKKLHVRGLRASGVKFSLVNNPAFHRYRALLTTQMPSVVAHIRRALAVAETLRTYHDDVLPAYRRGDVVLCDRYWLDTVSYLRIRGLATEAELPELTGLRQCDLEIVLEVPLDLAEERCRRLGESWGEPMRRTLTAVTRELSERKASGAVVLDGRRPASDVADRLVSLVTERLEPGADDSI
jgi:thymidylate kinase